MPHLDRGLAPVVVEPVAIGHGGGHQLVDIDAIQSGDVDIVAGLVGHVRRVDALERAHAASARVAAAIVRQRRFTGNEAEGLGLHHHRPEAHLHADAAVALPVPALMSMSALMRTAPQWQLPL